MITAGQILTMAVKALRYDNTEKSDLYTPMTLAYWDLCELLDWPEIRKHKDITFFGGAISLGEDVIGCTAVIDSNGSPLWEIKPSDIQTTGGKSRWYRVSRESSESLSTDFDIQIVDADGANMSGTVTAHYWVYPAALSSDSDPILLPSSRALVINTLLHAMTLIDHDPTTAENWRGEFELAKAELIAKYRAPARYSGGTR